MKKIALFLSILVMVSFSTFVYAGDTIIIAGEEQPPFIFQENNVITGIDVDVAAAIFEKLGVKYSVQLLPWLRCWNNLVTGEVDVGVAVSKKAEREEFVYYPENFVWESKFVFFTNKVTKDKFVINSYEDIKKNNLRIGIINGNSYNDGFWQAFPFKDKDKKVYNDSLEPVNNIELNLKKLENNRINIYPADKTVGLYTIKKLGLKLTYYDYVPFSKPYPNVFSKASKFKSDKYKNITEVMKAYDAELANFKKTQQYKDIFKKYEE